MSARSEFPILAEWVDYSNFNGEHPAANEAQRALDEIDRLRRELQEVTPSTADVITDAFRGSPFGFNA